MKSPEYTYLFSTLVLVFSVGCATATGGELEETEGREGDDGISDLNDAEEPSDQEQVTYRAPGTGGAPSSQAASGGAGSVSTASGGSAPAAGTGGAALPDEPVEEPIVETPGNCISFSGSTNDSGSFGTTEAVCFTVDQSPPSGWAVYSLNDRSVSINGQPVTSGDPFPGSAPYTVAFTAGSTDTSWSYW